METGNNISKSWCWLIIKAGVVLPELIGDVHSPNLEFHPHRPKPQSPQRALKLSAGIGASWLPPRTGRRTDFGLASIVLDPILGVLEFCWLSHPFCSVNWMSTHPKILGWQGCPFLWGSSDGGAQPEFAAAGTVQRVWKTRSSASPAVDWGWTRYIWGDLLFLFVT